MDDRRQEANFLRELLADTLDTLEQFAVRVLVDERNQPVADFETERVDHRHVVPACLGVFGRLERRRRHIDEGRRGLHVGRALLHHPANLDQAAAQQQEGEVRHAWNQPHHHENGARDDQHAWVREQLAGQLRTDVLVGRDPRHDHTGSGRDHQRRDLRDEAVADGE